MNPFLGWRAIRFCLQETGHFRDPTAGHFARQRRRQREDDVSDDFRLGGIEPGQRDCRKMQGGIARGEGMPFDENMEIGAMIEIPSAVLVAMRWPSG